VKKLFVGSLAWATTDDDLREFFAQFGQVNSASVVRDRDSDRSRGFGFVEFENDEEADKAIKEADGKELNGRQISVSEAQSRGPRESGSRDNDRGGYRGGRGGGYRDNGRGNGGGSFRSRSW